MFDNTNGFCLNKNKMKGNIFEKTTFFFLVVEVSCAWLYSITTIKKNLHLHSTAKNIIIVMLFAASRAVVCFDCRVNVCMCVYLLAEFMTINPSAITRSRSFSSSFFASFILYFMLLLVVVHLLKSNIQFSLLLPLSIFVILYFFGERL